MSSFQEVEVFENQHCYEENVDYEEEEEEEERELEEALSLSDLPINTISPGNEVIGAKVEEENQIEGDNLDFDFDFGSLIGSMSALDGEMCVADEVFSGGQILPYRNSVSSMSGLRSVSRSDSIDRRGFGSRSNSSSRSSRSSSIRSHYSATSSSGSSSCSNTTGISAKTVPIVSKTKVQNQFHSYPSPKPQIMGSGARITPYGSPIGKKSKMWEILKLGLVRTPEIELQDLKSRNRTNNFGKTLTIPLVNSTSSNNSISNNKVGNNNNNNNNDRARKSCSDGNTISDFVLEMQKRKNKLASENKIGNNNINNGGFFKSCKCSTMAIDPIPIRPNYGVKSDYFGFGINKLGNSQKNSAGKRDVLNEDKNLAQKKHHQLLEEQQQQQRRNDEIRQGKQHVMSHHHHRTFEWLKNLSHASILNDS